LRHSVAHAHFFRPFIQKLAGLREVVGVPAVRAMERALDERCFMLGFLDRSLTEKNRGPVAENGQAPRFLRNPAIAPTEMLQVGPGLR